MSYKIVVDSCCDLPVEKRRDPHFQVVPLTLIVDGHHIIDDETFDQADFLRRVRESPNCPRSSCPSPESYRNAYQGADDIYVVTLSGNLSGSYNSAVQGKLLYEEDNGSKIFLLLTLAPLLPAKFRSRFWRRSWRRAGLNSHRCASA